MLTRPLCRTLGALAGLAFAAGVCAANVVATLPAEVNPTAIALNPVSGKTYAANRDSDTVTVIDNATNQVATVKVGKGPWGLAVNSSTNRIYVANFVASTVSVIDGRKDDVLDAPVATSGAPNAIALNAVTNLVYTANANGTVTVIDGESGRTTTFDIGGNLVALAVNPVTNRIYVANSTNNTVAVIDGDKGTVTTVAADKGPVGVAVNPVTNRVYVTNRTSDNVTVINGATNEVVGNFATGGGPYAIAVNPATNRVYIANTTGNSVTVLNGVDNTTASVLAGTRPVAVSINVATNQVFVANQDSGTLMIIDGSTNLVIPVLATGTTPRAVVVNPLTNRAYVANGGSASVTVIDGWSQSLSNSVSVPAPILIALNPITNRIYAVNNSGTMTVIDGSTGGTASVTVGSPPAKIAINFLTNRIYVTAYNSNNSVTVVDGETNATVTVPVDGNAVGIDVDPVTDRIYAANRNGTTVTVIDGPTNTTTSIAVGTHPWGVAVNPATGKIYVTNGSSDDVTVIDRWTNETTTIAFGAGDSPREVVVNPVTNKVYVANYFGNKITIIDGATNATTSVASAPTPTALALNAVTNKIYVAHHKGEKIVVIDGANNATTMLTVESPLPYPGNLNDGVVAVNPVTNKIYAVDGYNTHVTVIDGVTNTTTTMAFAGAGAYSLAVDPATNRVYIPDWFGNHVKVFYEAGWGPGFGMANHAPTASLPLEFATTLTSPSLAVAVGSAYAPADPAVRTVRFRVGDANGAYGSATGSGPFTAALTSLVPGLNFVSLFVLDAMEGTATNASGSGIGGTTSITGAPRVAAIVYIPPLVTTVALPDATYLTAYASTVEGAGLLEPLAFSITAGALPPGVNLDGATGALSGAPSVVGTFGFTVTATDPAGGTGRRALSIVVGKAPQYITFGNFPVLSPTSPPFTLPLTGGGSGNPVYVVSLTPDICTANGPTGLTMAFFGGGTCQITATQAGDANYEPGQLNLNFAVKIVQTIAFAQPPDRRVGDANVALSATGGSSANPVFFFSLTQAVCSTGGTNGASVALLAAGTCTIEAGQLGDATHHQAPFVDRTFNIFAAGAPGAPVIGAATAGNASIGVAFGAPASAGSSAILDYTATCGAQSATGAGSPIAVAGLSNGTAYTCTVVARNAAGSGPPSAASNSVTPQGTQAIVFAPLPDRILGDAPFTMSASGGASGNPVVIASQTTGVCTISGNVVTLLAAGTCTLAANQAGNGSFTAAAQVTQSFTVAASTTIPRLANISTRGQVQTGFNVMIGGFVISGSSAKTVVVRATGPSLASFGVSGALPNPTLQLVRSSDNSVIATNDDWGSAANAAQIASSGFAPSNPLESAILATLPPGAYTAIVSGVGGGTGVGLVEVYEVDHPEIPLINISTRGQVQSGFNVMIGGFVVQGSGPQTVVIRAIGPSLANFGVSGALANPTMSLVRMSDNATIATNDDWGSAANAAQISSSGFAPSNPLESAILMTLAPGAYTAVVSGVGGGTGVGLVEVYKVGP